jgi:hypothetical protein
MDTTNQGTSGGPQPASKPATEDLDTWPHDALVAEVRRLRDVNVVNWGDSPRAKVIAAYDTLRLIANSIRADGAVITANRIEECVAVIRKFHELT